MPKQAIIRNLNPQDVANMLMAYVYGEGSTEEDVKRKSTTAYVDKIEGDLILVKALEEEAYEWLDKMIEADIRQGQSNREAQRLRDYEAMKLRMIEDAANAEVEEIKALSDGQEDEVV